MSLFPRFIESEFAPARDLFRLMDDYAAHAQTRSGSSGSNNNNALNRFRTFTPKFDVKETKDAYELHGELPGIEQKNISVEFTDAQTLTIKGRTERVREEGTRPEGLIEGAPEQGKITADGAGYQKPSVEEDGAAQTQVLKKDGQEVEVKQKEKEAQKERYWVSERSVGEFARTFSFPTRVDQDNVRASLKDGILAIVVPKAQEPVGRRIAIE